MPSLGVRSPCHSIRSMFGVLGLYNFGYGSTKDETPYKPKLTLNVLKFLKSYIIINIIGLRCTYWIIIRVAWSSQKIAHTCTGKSLSEALIPHSMTKDCSLNYKFNTRKFQAQTWGEHVVYRKWFWHSEHNIVSPYSAKIRASDKDLPVPVHFVLPWFGAWVLPQDVVVL